MIINYKISEYQYNQLNLRSICNKIGTLIRLIKLIFTDLYYNKKVTDKTTVEDVYEQFQMLLDIEESEWQIENNLTFSHEEVKQEAHKWICNC